MSDDLTVRPIPDPRLLQGNVYWQMSREIKKQESLHPEAKPDDIKDAIQLAFQKAGGDPNLVTRYVAMFLKP